MTGNIGRAGITFVRTIVLGLVVAVGVAGCGGSALRQSFNDYSAIYAGVTNRQLLLNLARSANDHPPHFLQLGLINTSFSFASNATATVGNVATTGRAPASPTAMGPFHYLTRIFSLGGSLGSVVSETPTFSLTPLSGPQFAQGFMTPVPPQVFFALLDQGHRVDQLLRVLVHAVDFTGADGRTVTLVNVPTADSPTSWVQFVRLAGILNELQRRHLLEVSSSAIQVPQAGPVFTAPTIEETLKAAEKGMTLKEVSPGKYVLTSFAPSTGLKIAPGAEAVFREMMTAPYFQLDALAPSTKEGAPAKPPGSMALRLRSFFTALNFTASEQEIFETLAARPGFLEGLPPSERHPVIRLLWDGTKPEDLEPPLVTVDYGAREYAIADLRGQSWNREVFALLSIVYNQISLDPKNLPVQQLINVR